MLHTVSPDFGNININTEKQSHYCRFLHIVVFENNMHVQESTLNPHDLLKVLNLADTKLLKIDTLQALILNVN